MIRDYCNYQKGKETTSSKQATIHQQAEATKQASSARRALAPGRWLVAACLGAAAGLLIVSCLEDMTSLVAVPCWAVATCSDPVVFFLEVVARFLVVRTCLGESSDTMSQWIRLVYVTSCATTAFLRIGGLIVRTSLTNKLCSLILTQVYLTTSKK